MSQPVESVLIPTDDSDGALAGVKRGIALASRIDADVHVLSVVKVQDSPIDPDDVPHPPFEAKATAAVEAVEQTALDYDEELDITTTVKRGTPFQTIREYATRHEIDVIAMGTKGRTGIDEILLGSVTENILRTARTPVLAVPPDADEVTIDDVTFDRLLLPTDGSHGATVATEWGIALATRLGSKIHTVYSVETTSFSREEETDELRRALEQHGKEAIETVEDIARDAGVSVSSSIVTGPPANAILTSATDHDADLITMGTHGRTGIGQWFLGSVTENVVRQADTPVFCVPVSVGSP